MVNFLSSSSVDPNGSGSTSGDTSRNSVAPPWQQEELLYEPPMGASHGFVTTHYVRIEEGDQAESFPTFTNSSVGDSSGDFVIATSRQDPLQTSDPWAGRRSAPGRTAAHLLQGLWDRYNRPAGTAPSSYGPARSQTRAQSAPAEARAAATRRSGPSEAATPAAPTVSTPVLAPRAGGGTTPVEVQSPAPAYTIADIQRAVQQRPWTQNAGPGFTTPVQPEPMHYVGPPVNSEPPERRQGGPLLSESLLHSLLASCTLSNSVRPADPNIFRPQYMRTLLPVSSLGAYGATPSEHTLPATAFMPSDPMERVAESIRLITESRMQSRGYHQSQPPGLQPPEGAASTTWATSTTPAPTTPAPTSRRAEGASADPTPMESGGSPQEEVVPHFYDGDERVCSLCLEEFVPEQRVCRLSCRHMYHAGCWEDLSTNRARQGHLLSLIHI